MKKVRNFLEQHEWSLLMVFTILSIGMGFAGFWIYFKGNGEQVTLWGLLYVTLQLFTLGSGFPGGQVPEVLNIARFLAPATLAVAAAKTFIWLLGDQIRQFRMRNSTGHTVVCGANVMTARLIRNLLDQGDRPKVIVVDRIMAIPDDLKRHRRLLAVVGEPTDPETLRHARVTQATYLICMDSDPHSNLTVAASVLNMEQTGGLKIFCQLDNPKIIEQFYALNFLKHLAPDNGNSSRASLQVFNLKERAARLILQEYSPDTFHPELHAQNRPAHVVLAGLGSLGEALVLQIARMCHFGNRQKTRLTVVDERKGHWEQFLLTFPNLPDILDLAYYPEIPTELLQQQIDCFYLSPDRDTDSLGLLQELYPADQQNFPIVLCIEEEESFLQYYRGKNLYHFNLPEMTLTFESVVKEAIDRLAQVIHLDYLEKQQVNNTYNPKKATHQVWDNLPEKTRSQNRNQADHLYIKVRAAGAKIVVAHIEGDAVDFSAQPLLERLAEAEHNRWMAHELLYDAAKSHESLAPYHQLSDPVKQYDRDAVANIPALLARLGMKPVLSDSEAVT